MKLIMENWNQFISEEQSKLSPEQQKALRLFVGDVLAVVKAAEDSSETNEARKKSPAHTAHKAKLRAIRKRADLLGIDESDWTPEQRALYNEKRREYEQQVDERNFSLTLNLTSGDLLNIPGIKQVVDARGGGFRKFITGLASAFSGNTACAEQNELTVGCLLGILSAEATG